MTDENDQMREFILLSENLFFVPDPEPTEVLIETVQETVRHPILDDLDDLMFRLRSLMETEGGEFAFGVETGMRRAADMIENMIKRHEDNDLGTQI